MVIVSPLIIRFFEMFFFRNSNINAMSLWPFVVLSDKRLRYDEALINHERIHLRQQIELLIIPFYVWYVIAYWRKGYMGVSFEQEAYTNDHDLGYLRRRKPFAFLRYVRKNMRRL